MKRSFSDLFIAIGTWATVPTYLAVWSVLSSRGFDPQLAPVALVLSVTYAAFHVYEIVCRHHCLLSADATAVPAVIVAYGLLSVSGYCLGRLNVNDLFDLAFQSSLAFVAGHLVALAVAYSIEWCGQSIDRFVHPDNAP